MWSKVPWGSLLALAAGAVACSVSDSGVPRDAGGATTPTGTGSEAGVGGSDLDAGPVDAGSDAAVDHSDLLPAGVTPPTLWFWRGITQDNLSNWRTDASGRRCADGDTTMWFHCPGNSVEGCQGAPACDPDHFGTPEAPCTGVDCCWRNWDDPRGPEFRVSNATGPVEVHNFGAQGLDGGVPEYGFGVTVCAPPGTQAIIDTCPRPDLYSCVEDRYPQFVDDCTTVLLSVADNHAPSPDVLGCYSTKADVTITF